jgi:hypothetical protein
MAKVCLAGLSLIATIPLLSGCTSGLQAIGDTLRYAVSPDRRVLEAKLNPEFDYLRVRVNGRLAILALGAVDSLAGRSVHVFFSGEKETLKLFEGRIVEFSSPGQHVRLEVPPSGFPQFKIGLDVTFSRTMDTRPSYAFSVPQTRRLKYLEHPPGKTDLVGIDPRSLTWFEEHALEEISRTPQLPLKPKWSRALYAVLIQGGQASIVYSEQCISPDLCLSLQRWRATGSY